MLHPNILYTHDTFKPPLAHREERRPGCCSTGFESSMAVHYNKKSNTEINAFCILSIAEFKQRTMVRRYFSTPTPVKGARLVYVYYFCGYGNQRLTTAQVLSVKNEGSPDRKQENFTIPLRNPGELTLVKRFNY